MGAFGGFGNCGGFVPGVLDLDFQVKGNFPSERGAEDALLNMSLMAHNGKSGNGAQTQKEISSKIMGRLSGNS